MRTSRAAHRGRLARPILLLALLVAVGTYASLHIHPPSSSLPVLPVSPSLGPASRPAPPAPPLDVAPAALPATASAPPSLPSRSTARGPEAALTTIAQLLEQGREDDAEQQLRALPADALANLRFRHYAAVLWNNLGVRRGSRQGPGASVESFKMAVSLNPGDRTAVVNLTHAWWATRDAGLTHHWLEQTIRLAPDDPVAHLALADMLYAREDLGGASRHLEEATRLVDGHPELRGALDALAAKVRRTAQAEQRYLSRASSHFTVKFDGEEDYAIWTQVLDILEEAYREIGGRFGYYPSQPIVVVLHTRARFQAATGGPAWADGLFDSALGRIQVPTQGALTDPRWLTQVLRHEFVHALLHQRMAGRLAAVPTWLNEGLAMQLAADAWPDLDVLGPEELQLIPLHQLEQSWVALPPPIVMLAYLEGNSAAQYLIDRYGMEKVREIVGGLADGHGIGRTIHDRLFISYEDFQRRWLEDVRQRLSRG